MSVAKYVSRSVLVVAIALALGGFVFVRHGELPLAILCTHLVLRVLLLHICLVLPGLSSISLVVCLVCIGILVLVEDKLGENGKFLHDLVHLEDLLVVPSFFLCLQLLLAASLMHNIKGLEPILTLQH